MSLLKPPSDADVNILPTPYSSMGGYVEKGEVGFASANRYAQDILSAAQKSLISGVGTAVAGAAATAPVTQPMTDEQRAERNLRGEAQSSIDELMLELFKLNAEQLSVTSGDSEALSAGCTASCTLYMRRKESWQPGIRFRETGCVMELKAHAGSICEALEQLLVAVQMYTAAQAMDYERT